MKNFSICLVVIFCLLLFEVLSAESLDASSIQTLQNIDKIYLQITKSETSPNIIYTQPIHDKIELELRKFGFKIGEESQLDYSTMSEEELSKYFNYIDHGYLVLSISVLHYETYGLYFYVLNLTFQRSCVTSSPPYLRIYPTTLSDMRFAVSGSQNLTYQMNIRIDDMLTSFLNNYLKANNNKQPDELTKSKQLKKDKFYLSSEVEKKIFNITDSIIKEQRWILAPSFLEKEALDFLQYVSHLYIKETPKEELIKIKDSLTQVYNLPKRNLQADIDSLKKEGLFPEQKEKED